MKKIMLMLMVLFLSQPLYAITMEDFNQYNPKAKASEHTIKKSLTELKSETGVFGNIATVGFIAAFAIGVFLAVFGFIKLSQSKRDGGDGAGSMRLIFAGSALSILSIIIAMTAHLIIKGT